MRRDVIYLDYNATCLMREGARKAMEEACALPLNASSVHGFGQRGRGFVEEARASLGAAIKCPAAQITFNSGATEGNNTLLRHFEALYPGDMILVSAIEHPSIFDVPLARRGVIPVDGDGVIDLAALEALLKGQRCSLVSVMMANNEIGTIQPIAQAAKLAHRYGALFHSDITQGLGRIPIDMQALGVDFMTMSAHKIGGAQGAGALAVGLCGVSPVWLYGGGQEKKLRAGTENVAGIAAFGAAVSQACDEDVLRAEAERLTALRDRLEGGLLKAAPACVIHGRDVLRLPNTVSFALPDAKAESLLMNFDLAGFALSNGSACSSGTVKASHVLTAMGAADPVLRSTLRVSLGWGTTQQDIDAFLAVWGRIQARYS